jgi:hypothetical protein
MRKIFFMAMALFLVTVNAFAIDDTIINRRNEAEKYLKVMPPNVMFDDMATKMARNLPSEYQNMFMDLMKKNLDIDAVAKLMKDSMVKYFTADELGALADFYGSPLGQSAMKKFGAYMAYAMPKIQEEILKAGERAIKELKTSEK